MKTNKRIIMAALVALTIAAPLTIQAQAPESKPAPPVQHGTLKDHSFTNTRNMRFGEILVVKSSGVEVYNTTGINDCPANLWDAVNPEQLAKQLGATKVFKNGPHFWMMDEQTVSFGETATFDGLKAGWVATLPLAIAQKQLEEGKPYTIFTPKKKQRMVYSKGKPVYELVDPDGNSYVLQARDEQHPIESLATMGQKMKKLPEGWHYRTRTLTEDLVLNLTPDQTIYAVGDEFNQYYTRPPTTK